MMTDNGAKRNRSSRPALRVHWIPATAAQRSCGRLLGHRPHRPVDAFAHPTAMRELGHPIAELLHQPDGTVDLGSADRDRQALQRILMGG
ncbi:hypothetical protein [Streptomyces sp. R44]|uniref:Uncharacterized protein n=1 Tax=Streptomyces sp. R44 TaxID=3238633 RepID=A0AB39SMZ8_9ACTN